MPTRTVNDALLDAAIRHQIYLQSYSTGQVYELLKILNEAEENLRNRLSARLEKIRDKGFDAGSFSTAKLDRELKEIQVIHSEVMNEIVDRLDGNMSDLADFEQRNEIENLDRSVSVRMDFASIPPTRIAALVRETPYGGRTLTEWAKRFADDDWELIRGNVRTGILEGMPTDQIMRRIFGTIGKRYEDAARRTTRRNLTTLVRTAVNHASTTAREAVAVENDSVVKGIRWVSTLDGRTSLICMNLDGKIFPVGKGPRPPAHPNCRSTIVIITKSWKELGVDAEEASSGTRASMNGQVPAKTTYAEWLKQQSAEFQDDVLGPSRAKLFREGGLKLDRFVDDAGKTLTLAQLGEAEGLSQTWKTLGLPSSKEVDRRNAPPITHGEPRNNYKKILEGFHKDPQGKIVEFDKTFYKHSIEEKPGERREKYIGAYRETIKDPNEIWIYTREGSARRGYFGFFEEDNGKIVNIFVATDGRDGRNWKAITGLEKKSINKYRAGKLIYRKK